MHSLETLLHLNSEGVAATAHAVARALNNPPSHPKAWEKGYPVAESPFDWTSDAEWEAKMKREGKR